MRSIARPVGFVMLVGCFLVAWNIHADRDGAVAQRRKPIVVTRIFTGPDDQTHAENIDMKLTPSGGSGDLSEMVKVNGLQFRRQAPNYFQDWHTAPRRQYVITLSGRGEVELVGGKKIPLDPGHILLAERSEERRVGKECRL